MPIRQCCVPKCDGGTHEPLHSFPNPEKDKERFNAWVQTVGSEILGLDNDRIFKGRRVCHSHFESKYLCRNKRISTNAVPTLNFPEKCNNNDNDFIIIMDYENICRLCLRSTGAKSDIFTTTHGEKSMQQQILCITGLAIEEDDGLPSKICEQCRHVVVQACKLRDVVDKTSKMLYRTALNSNEKCSGSVSNNQNQGNDYANAIVAEKSVNCKDDSHKEVKNVENDVCSDRIDLEQKQEEFENDITNEHNKEQDIAVKIPVTVPKRSCNGKRPAEVVCQLCLTRFANKEDLRKHVRKHYLFTDLEIYLDVKSGPFRCTYCDEVQLNMPQLVKHHRLHLGVNPYVCKHPGCSYAGKDGRPPKECGAAFLRRSELVSHVMRTHPTAVQAVTMRHVCSSCGFRARNEPALRRHIKAHHFTPSLTKGLYRNGTIR